MQVLSSFVFSLNLNFSVAFCGWLYSIGLSLSLQFVYYYCLKERHANRKTRKTLVRSPAVLRSVIFRLIQPSVLLVILSEEREENLKRTCRPHQDLNTFSFAGRSWYYKFFSLSTSTLLCQRRRFNQDCPGLRQVEMNWLISFCSSRPDEDQGNPGRNVVFDKKVCWCWGKGTSNRRDLPWARGGSRWKTAPDHETICRSQSKNQFNERNEHLSELCFAIWRLLQALFITASHFTCNLFPLCNRFWS